MIKAMANRPITAFACATPVGYALSALFVLGSFAVGMIFGMDEKIRVLNYVLFAAAALLMLIAIMPVGMPWSLGVKPLMLEKIPQDGDSINQLTFLHFTFAVQNLTTACWLVFLACFACKVLSGSLVLAYFLTAAAWGLFNMYGKHADKVGLDRRLMPIQMGLLGVIAIALIVGVLVEAKVIDLYGADDDVDDVDEGTFTDTAAAVVSTAEDEGEARRQLSKIRYYPALISLDAPKFWMIVMAIKVICYSLFAIFKTPAFLKSFLPAKPPPNEYVAQQSYVYVRATALEMIFQQAFTLVGLRYASPEEVALFAGMQWLVMTVLFVFYTTKSSLYGMDSSTLAPFIALFAFMVGVLLPYAGTTLSFA